MGTKIKIPLNKMSKSTKTPLIVSERKGKLLRKIKRRKRSQRKKVRATGNQ